MELKENIRRNAITQRKKLSLVQIKKTSKMIGGTLADLSEYKRAKTIIFYAAINNEVATGEMIIKALEQGKRVCLPVSDFKAKKIIACEVSGQNRLKKSSFGIPEPSVGSPVVKPDEIDLAVIPAVLFDRKGYRLGYGGGFYDRFLPLLRADAFKVGMALEMQIVEELPAEAHDQRIDCLVTEKKIYRFKS